jgi:hypothetical protein
MCVSPAQYEVNISCNLVFSPCYHIADLSIYTSITHSHIFTQSPFDLLP